MSLFRVLARSLTDTLSVFTEFNVIHPFGVPFFIAFDEYDIRSDVPLRRQCGREKIPAVCGLDSLEKIDFFALGIHAHAPELRSKTCTLWCTGLAKSTK